MKPRFAWAFGLLACCNITVNVTDPPKVAKTVGGLTEGSRLKVTYLNDGTSDFPLSFFDTQTQTTCIPAKFNGETRCWPLLFSGLVFSDATCTKRVLQAPKPDCGAVGLSESPYGLEMVSPLNACGAPTLKAYERGAKISAPAKTYYMSGGTCYESGAPTAAVEFFEVGAEVASSVFARFSEVDESDLASPLLTTALESEDGARLTMRGLTSVVPFGQVLQLKYANKVCQTTKTSDGKVRCVPATDGYISTPSYEFSNADCTSPVGWTDSTSCQPASGYFTRLQTAANGCYSGDEIVEAGAVVTQIYQGSPSACAAGAPSSTNVYRAIGAVVPPSTFPELTPVSVGAGRLQLKLLQSGNIVTSGTYSGVVVHDTQLDIDCQTQPSGDKYKCVPYRTLELVYSDPACTLGVGRWVDVICSTAPKYLREQLTTVDACGTSLTRFYAAGAKITKPAVVYLKNDPGGCMPAVGPMPGDYYALGAVVSEDTFATMTVTTSP